MGSASSVVAEGNIQTHTKISLKQLPNAIEESLYIHEKFPFIIDKTEQAGRFLKYQLGSFVNFDDPSVMNARNLNRNLVGAMLHGRTMTIKMNTTEGLVEENIFKSKEFPKEVISRDMFLHDDIWTSILKKELGDPEPGEAILSPEFVFIIVSTSDYIHPLLQKYMYVIEVVENVKEAKKEDCDNDSRDMMEQVASLYGASEIIRNSTELVESSFDGDLDEVKRWIDLGYHIESADGRKNSALSEASAQNHIHVVTYLLELGCDPNKSSDTGRTPLWRSCFNGFYEVSLLLLEAGADPDVFDKISLETCFDVCKTDELRQLVQSWDRNKTANLIETRKQHIYAKIEERIKTSSEREQLAKQKLRLELVQMAKNGDLEGIKSTLTMIASEAESSNSKPRITAECRNELGQSLLSIAVQANNEELTLFLLTYWKSVDKDRWDLVENELSVEAQVFKTNPNSRDLKGWNCCCIAVFHNSLKALRLLLEYGGDPSLKSSYQKNAWDLAKDELDAAGNIVKNNKEIRQVLEEYDLASKSKMFGTGKILTNDTNCMYNDLDSSGSPVVMQVEMNKERENEIKEIEKKGKQKKSTKKKK